MKINKIIFLGLIFLVVSKVNSQTMITSNIQSHLVDKKWSSTENNSKEVMFEYSAQGSLSVYLNGQKTGYEDYYITSSDCSLNSNFDDSKIGSTSSGNYIKTRGFCYVIEFFSDYKKIRMKPSQSPEWQTFYLLEE